MFSVSKQTLKLVMSYVVAWNRACQVQCSLKLRWIVYYRAEPVDTATWFGSTSYKWQFIIFKWLMRNLSSPVIVLVFGKYNIILGFTLFCMFTLQMNLKRAVHLLQFFSAHTSVNSNALICVVIVITETRLFKYIENFTTKNGKISR